MKTRKLLTLALCVFGTFALSSCDDENDKEVKTAAPYIIVATPDGSLGEGADYVLQSESLNEGTITTKGAGIEQDGYRYYIFNNNKVFSLLYGQGNPGDVTVYNLNPEGTLQHVATVNTPSVQVYGKYNKELILIKTPRSGDTNAEIIRINTDDPKIADTKHIDVVELAGNGERAHFSGVFQVDDKVYAPYYCIKGITGEVFHSNYSDSMWVAVFSYPDMKLEKVIKDNRTSHIGYYGAQSGLQQVASGDVYAFSTATLGGDGVVPSTKPSAALRIKKGESEFDEDYFFNVQEKSGGHHLFSAHYVSDNKFVLRMYPVANSTTFTNGLKFAIVDVVTQSFTWVTGMPEPVQIDLISRLPYVSEDGKSVSWGVTTKQEHPHIYTIDVATATAKKGLKVEAGSITALGKLAY